MEKFTTAEPHYIPGYTGYCPRYHFAYGDTYGRATHKLLLDPTISHAKAFILSDRAAVHREIPSKCDIDVVNARFERTDAIYVHPMLPGYEGFIPRSNTKLGQRYTILTTQRLAEFERQQSRNKAALNQLKETIDGQPALANLAETFGKKRYARHVPHGRDSVSHDFARNYRKERCTECGPITVVHPDLPLLVQPSEIHHKHIGMIPNYLGHIPGMAFRCGKTFGADTKNTKKWLQRDSSACDRMSRRRCARNVR